MDERLKQAQTVIFDIGSVLVDFDIEKIAQQMLPKRLVKYIHEPFFIEQWLKLDDGSVTSVDSARLVCEKFNLNGDEELFQNVMDNFCEVCPPLPLASSIPELKAAGKKVYLLTNYGDVSFARSKNHYSFLQEVDGEVVSARVKTVKPEDEIYKILLDRYDIDPTTAVYLDDRLENIQAGRKFNLESIWYPSEYVE